MSIDVFAAAFADLMSPSVFIYLAIGVLLGTMIGASPAFRPPWVLPSSLQSLSGWIRPMALPC